MQQVNLNAAESVGSKSICRTGIVHIPQQRITHIMIYTDNLLWLLIFNFII